MRNAGTISTKQARSHRVAVGLVAASISIVSLGAAQGATLTVATGAPQADRSSTLCIQMAACVDGYPDKPTEAPVWARPTCLSTAVIVPSPIGKCEVVVTVPVSGKGTAGSKITVTTSLRSATGVPWSHPESEVMNTIEETLPAPLPDPGEVPIPADGIGFAEEKPGEWSSSKKVTVSNSGKYSTTFTFRFEAAGPDDHCNNFTVRATAKSGSYQAIHFVTRRICA